MTLLKLIASVSLLTTLTACSKNTIAIDHPIVCESWETIRPSRKEDKLSGETAKQIAGNNVAREAWCTHPPKFASIGAKS